MKMMQQLQTICRGMVGLSMALNLFVPSAQAVALDTFVESFDSRTADVTIDSQELWKVTAGAVTSAVVQSSVTPTGTGKAMKLTGASSPVTADRSTSYGGASPTWVRFLIRAGLGGEQRPAPSAGIAAVTFDFSGRILAADGKSWVDTGQTFTANTWWEVLYKLDFTNHTYDLYLSPVGIAKVTFTPVKSGLNFIDASKSKLSSLQFQGGYRVSQPADAYVDDLSVTYIDRLEWISAAQTLVQDQVSGPLTVQLQNSLREPQRAVADTFLDLQSTSTAGRFSLERTPWTDASQALLPKDATSVTFYYKDGKVGKPLLSVNESPDQGWLAGLQEQKVISKQTHFEVLASGPQVAAQPFTVTIYARTEEGALNDSYSGTVSLEAHYVSPSGGTMLLVPTEAGGFSQGKRELEVMYPDAGVIAIAVMDTKDSSQTGTSGEILVLPARFQVEAGSPQVVGRPFPVSVTALSASGSMTPNYQGAVTLGIQAVSPITSAGSLSPAAINAASFQAGKATVDVTYPSWGTLLLKAADAASPMVSGQSGPIAFHPETIELKAIPLPPPPRDFFYIGEAFQLQVTPRASGGAVIANYQGTVALVAPATLGLPDGYTFGAAEAGVHAFPVSTNTASGKYEVSVKDAAAGITSPALSLTVKEAFLKVVSTVATVGGATEVTILLVDDKGKVIESESSATLNVKLIEDNPNQSVSSQALTQPIQVTQGKATFVVANTEAETVTVLPSSLFGLKVQAGTVSFGRFAARGIGVLMWREVPGLRR